MDSQSQSSELIRLTNRHEEPSIQPRLEFLLIL